MPAAPGQFYLEWNQVLFMHWAIEPELLQSLVPEGIEIDTFEGNAWVSVVAFRMEGLYPRNLFPVSLLSDFDELNIRTYVKHNQQAGVFFISIEAEKWWSCWLARVLARLPYRPALQQRSRRDSSHSFASSSQETGFSLEVQYQPGDKLTKLSPLDLFLTERYCLYHPIDDSWQQFNIHHAPWRLHSVDLSALKIDYSIGNLPFHRPPDLLHYSQGVQVVTWPGRKLC